MRPSQPTEIPTAPGEAVAPARTPFSRRLVDDVLDRMTDGVWAVDAEWRFTYVNARAARRFGRPPHELIGESLPELFPQLASDPFSVSYRRAMATQQPVEFEARSALEDQWSRVRAHPSPQGLTVFFEDISAERRARDESRRVHEVLDATQDLVALADISGQIIHLNPAARRVMRLTADEPLAALEIADFFPPSVHSFLFRDGLPKLLVDGHWRGSMPVSTRDGRVFTAEIAANVHHDEDGIPQYFSAIVRDVSEERARQSRLERQARQQAMVADLGVRALGGTSACELVGSAIALTMDLVGAAGVAYFDVLPGLRELVWRQAAGTFAGETLGRVIEVDEPRFGELLRHGAPAVSRAPAGADQDAGWYAGVSVRGRTRVHGLLKVRFAGGTAAESPTAEDIAFLQLVANVLASAIERAEAEQALTRARDFYFTLFDAFPTLNWRAASDGGRDYFNRTWLGFTGRAVDDERGDGWLQHVHHEDRDRVAGVITRAVATRAAWEVEYRLLHNDGRHRWILEHGGPYREIDGETRGFVGSCSDITEQRTLAEELRQALRLEAVGRLAGGVAHDFNNLITTIKGHGELALEDAADCPDIQESVREMINAADRGASLTRQLLLFSRREVTQPQTLRLNARIVEFERLMRRVLPESIALSMTLDVSDPFVFVDAGQLDQVLMNLVVNARDALPAAGGRIRVSTDQLRVGGRETQFPRAVAPGAWVRLTVDDTGFGMDADTLARIFEPFFTTKPQGEGTGLGLSTVYGIVTKAGGHVWAESSAGAGSRFTVLLPARSLEDEAPMLEESSGPKHQQGSETILVIEDEPAVRALVRRTLERQGYRVLDAADGIEALQLAVDHPADIHLVLSDVVMPRLNGPEALSRLRQARPGIRCLLMSGYAADTLSTESLQRDGLRMIEKPFSPNALVEAVRDLLDDRGEHRA